MRFHKEGRVSIILAAVVSLVLLLIAHYAFGQASNAKPVAVVIAALLMVTILQFFRYPQRRKLVSDGAVIAPADGKIVVIEEVEDHEYLRGKARQISIFMSPVNVHINWYPVNGKVVHSQYHPGKYLVAWNPKSSTLNERHTTVIKHPVHGDILVRQIAGALARRIVNYSKTGQEVEQGQELGFIKFGSRVDVLVPLNARIEVQLDQKTTGGQTILASFL